MISIRETPRRLLLTLAVASLAAAGSGASPPGRTNRLIDESSPYLQLHARNPVDWYPWGPEALERARREDKPIFLSIGYSTCYWCHVMEREVFSDPEIAASMNRWFVNVKVDREERPDLDEIYMAATVRLTGHGGWPNSVFLTPGLEPFFAGTYFPPEDGLGRPGFPTVLSSLHRAWEEQRAEVEERAAMVAAAVRRQLAAPLPAAGPAPPPEIAVAAARQLDGRFDERWGGFGSGPKFPSPGTLFLLWDRARQGDGAARRIVLESLRGMGRGALYDQLGGGFHRYTLDAAWRIPHFEKMLYDNALLTELLARVAAPRIDAEGSAIDRELERLARGTAEFLMQEMMRPEGVFKSAIDAETDGVEGAYYIWARAELEEVLTPSEFGLLAPIFGFDGEPNFEGERYTLYLTASVAAHAERLALPPDELLARLREPLAKLRARRSERPFPRVDDKVLTDWNGMAVAALATAGDRLAEPRYLEAARRAAAWLVGRRDSDGVLLHVWHDGQGRIRAFLDDYAFLIRGLLALDEATGEVRWLEEAERLAAELERRLGQPGGGYFAAEDRSDLLLRAMSAGDGAIPSGNGVAALNLLRLAERTGRLDYRRRAADVMAVFQAELEAQPAALATVAQAVGRYHAVDPAAGPPGELVSLRGSWTGPLSAAGWRPFRLDLGIRAGWHLNANPASHEFLIPTRLEGSVRQVSYPSGHPFRPDFADDVLKVYSGDVDLSGESRPGSEVTLTYQACDDRRCLPPETRVVELSEPGGS